MTAKTMTAKTIKVFLISITILFSSITFAFESLISATELNNKLNQSNLVILDVRSAAEFNKGHINNAINIPLKYFHQTVKGVRNHIISPVQFKQLLEKHGINNRDNIVIYDNGALLASTRVYWILEFYGHKDMQVLNGGVQAWILAQKPLVQGSNQTDVLKSNYILTINTNVLASKFETFMAIDDPNYIIIDSRLAVFFSGEKSVTGKKGRIPGAYNIPWPTVLNRTDHINYYKTLEELEVIFANIPPDKNIILYCCGGAQASIIYFALKKTGRQAKVYDGAWLEWSSDPTKPIETGFKQ